MIGRLLSEMWQRARRAFPGAPVRPDQQPLQLALERHAAGAAAEAEAICRNALRADPSDAACLHLLGYLMMQRGDSDQVIETYRRALVFRPDFAECHFHLAEALRARGDAEGAIAHFREAAALQPGFAAAYNNCATLLVEQDRLEEALAEYRRALAADAGLAATHLNIARTLRGLHRLPEALTHLERAATIDPCDPDVRFNHGLALLEAGDFRRGWPEYESRFEQRVGAPRRRVFPFPAWRSEPLAGKGILVWGEQGVGDEIQFASLLPELIGSAGCCVYECSAKLVPLLSRSFPRGLIVPRTDPPHAATQQGIDYQIAAGSAAQWLRPRLESFPQEKGYLIADPARVRLWRQRCQALGPGLTVGFSWTSSNLTGERALACTRLDQWEELFAVPGVRWICLQYGNCEDELEEARNRFKVELLRFGDVDYFDGLDEVAALMRALDVVISAPNAVSVQAAALGVEVWQMSYGPDWQVHGTGASPWFPTLVPFERRWNESWSEVLRRIAQRLRGRSMPGRDDGRA